MKVLISSLLLFFAPFLTNAQTITPSTDAIVCPGPLTSFSVSISGGPYYNISVAGTDQTGISGSVGMQVVDPIYVSYVINGTVVKFSAYVIDKAVPQGVRVDYKDGGGTQLSATFTYTKIASFNPASDSSRPVPIPSSIQATACRMQSFNISFPNVKYANIYTPSPITYGTVMNYEYLLPAGWQLGTSVSDGTAWIPGTSNVTVTSDLYHSGLIQVRGKPCSANQTPGPAAVINISRPQFSYSIAGSSTVCSGASAPYSVTGLQAGATVAWNASPSGPVTVDNPNNTTTTLTRVGTGVVTLTATITDVCGNINTAGYTVVAGTPTPSILSTTYRGTTFAAYATQIPGASYNWYFNSVQEAGHLYTISDEVICGTSNTLAVEATNDCGTSSRIRPVKIFIDCGGGGGSRMVTDEKTSTDQAKTSTNLHPSKQWAISPNPGYGIFKLFAKTSVPSKIYRIRVVDIVGRVRAEFNYSLGVISATLDLAMLEKGVYTLQLNDNTSWISRQLVILK